MPYFTHTQTQRIFAVVGQTPDGKKLILRGQHCDFEEPNDIEKIKNYGYVYHEGDAPASALVRAEPPAPPPPAPAAPGPR